MSPINLNLTLTLGSVGGGAGSPYSAEAEAYFAAMTTQGDATYKTWIDTFISKLKTDLLWNKIGSGWILANKDADASYINLKSPDGVKLALLGDLTAANGFTAYEGWSANATAGRALNTQIVPSNFGAGFVEDSGGISIYLRTNSAAIVVDGGCSNGNAIIALLCRDNAGRTQNSLNSSLALVTNWDAGTSNSSGLHTVMRRVSDNILSFRNSTLYKTVAGTTQTINSTRPLYLLAWNNNGSVANPSARQQSLCLVHGSLNDTELGLLNTHVAWFMGNTPAGSKAV